MKKRLLSVSMFLLCVGLIVPVFSSETADPGKAMERIKAELKAMEKLKPQAKCPISGKPVSDKEGFTYMGYRIKTCCPDCVKAVEKDPLSALLKMRKSGEEPALIASAKAQATCPISGKPISKEYSAVKDNMLVYFCCPNCPKAFKKEPTGTVKKMVEKGEAPVILTLEQTVCPVSGDKISGSNSVKVKGKIVELCCDACKAGVEKNPEKVLQAMADAGIVLKNAE